MAKLLLAEDDDAVRERLQSSLERDGFEVVAVPSVRQALKCIATEKFDVLLSNLHMPQPGDGFTVASAMRHTHPKAVTLVLGRHPELDEAISAIRSEADEVLLEPIEFAALGELIRGKLANRAPSKAQHTESVASILEQNLDATIQGWMKLVAHNEELSCVPLNFEDRIGHLPNLLADLISRILTPLATTANVSIPAREHGALRRKQGYTAAMLIEEYRILQLSIFNTLQSDLRRVSFNGLLLGVITIADEMDSQLKQAMQSLVGPEARWSAGWSVEANSRTPQVPGGNVRSS
jgi:DNA-binding NarL/FixJ family response regulator